MLQKIKQWLRFRRFDDAYATTKETLWTSIRQSLETQIAAGKAILLVVHFPDTFSYIQNQLAESSIDYEIASKALTPEFLLEPSGSPILQPGRINLVLSALIPAIGPATGRNIENQLSVLVVERHPLIDHDKRIHNFCKHIGAAIELGYFQSFEDPLVAAELNEMTLMLMEQLGLNDHSLINSMTLTRRIDRKLKRDRARYTSDVDADNYQQWLERNQPDQPNEAKAS